MNATDCDLRTEGDRGRTVFPGIRFFCIRDINVVRKRAGTILSDGINKYYLFCVVFMTSVLELSRCVIKEITLFGKEIQTLLFRKDSLRV
jgi:hypothetical protein